MRVALYFPDGAVAAYKLGRIVDGTHTTDILTGATTSITDLAAALAKQAELEFPQCEVKIERWVDNGDGTPKFVPVDEASDDGPQPSEVHEVELSTGQNAQAGVNN